MRERNSVSCPLPIVKSTTVSPSFICVNINCLCKSSRSIIFSSHPLKEHDLKIIGCGYDAHNIAGILAQLEEILPCDLTEIPQSSRSLNDVPIDFRQSVEAGIIRYDRQNSLLTWSMVNAILNEPNSFGEVKIDKVKQSNRIDPCDAVLDAYKLYFEDKNDRISEGEAALAAWLNVTSRK